MKLMPCGESGLLVEVDDLDGVLALYAELVDDPPEGVVDLVPASRTLMLRLDPTRTQPEVVAKAVEKVKPQQGAHGHAGLVEVPVTYDGEDLAEVGELTGLGERGVIEAHTGQEWTVAFCGFAPGFGYLVAADNRLHVPRRRNPRTKVPARSVALAGEFASVYPRESPGGWQLIGRTEVEPWDLRRDPPALMLPGTRVRFVEA